MDGRGWPWKRKSSDKATTEKPVVGNESTPVCSLSYLASLENQEKCKNTNYVQITMDSYTHMSRMEDQVKLFEVDVKDLKEKLTLAYSEIKTKESLILQHAKVAEEAVSGWEKADAETLVLKRQLESVTLLKLTAEDRASHLDDALKECTRQIRIVKDESDKKLQDVILAKTTHWDKIKAELEGKIDELSQGLHRAAPDNAALTRSLQERSEMIIRISEERSKAEADVEKLKTNLQLAEKEISSLKYDVHVASKEVEIRNEEKNMSLKSAEIANKQHLEGVKKIAKLEAECQRLRGLLRKKLPGPAAMAQMKLEVESLGHEFTDPRAQRNMSQNHNAHIAKAEISVDHKLEECKRENVYLTRRTLELEEEIQTLKEHLAARNNELQVSRNVCAKALGKLKILEGQMHMFNNDKSAPKSNSRNLSESPSSGHDHNYPPSVTSVSEDGFDEEGSSSECGPATSADSHKVRKVSVDGSSKPKISNRLELMDDFLEIEKLAANDPDGANSASKSSNSVCSSKDEDTTTLDQLLTVLRSRINRIFESQEGISIEKIVEAARFSIQEMQGSSPKQMLSHLFEVTDETLEKHVLSSQDIQNSEKEKKNTKQQDLEAAVSNIHHFIKLTTKEATQLQDMNGNGQLRDSLEDFSSSVSTYPTGESSLSDLVLELSRISVLASKETSVAESNDKVTFLQKEIGESDCDPLRDTYAKTEDHCVDNLINGHELNYSSCKNLLEEMEQLKLEKENIAVELSRCLQNLESTKAGLEAKEQLISKLKSQLTSSEDLQSLAETQLKCVTESYKTLELHAKDLEAKVKSLGEETERLELAFSTEKHGHEETLAKCRDLQEIMQRNETCTKCSSSKLQPNQEKDIASATEKLAACQETIHLLSQQLQSLQPQSNHILKSQSPEKKLQQHKTSEVTPNSAQDDLPHAHIIQPSRSVRHTVNPTVHAIIKSSSVSSSSKEDNEKHTRGLGRFFSSKPKNNGR
ncbi:Filament-like plant protein [Arabidopsis thaliana x Arabidopsis arenosa]|uniref:Filament-like plant protein n=1 Tax=Arabidopsis thaliana x Arabidopsis arenosa TaxID=1240361 RepID=A0A8T1XZI2_9BRAS|nr:Filament-like plant protein [Arabidopsis thaliana x Arabidopsis arenosa]